MNEYETPPIEMPAFGLAGTPPPSPPPTIDIDGKMVCPHCGKRCNGAWGLNAHGTRMHKGLYTPIPCGTPPGVLARNAPPIERVKRKYTKRQPVEQASNGSSPVAITCAYCPRCGLDLTPTNMALSFSHK